jgi:hypothetical protein
VALSALCVDFAQVQLLVHRERPHVVEQSSHETPPLLLGPETQGSGEAHGHVGDALLMLDEVGVRQVHGIRKGEEEVSKVHKG